MQNAQDDMNLEFFFTVPVFEKRVSQVLKTPCYPYPCTPLGFQDIASKIVAFSQDGPRTVCILSANGAVSNFTLRQLSMPGTAATYEVVHFYVSCLTTSAFFHYLA